MKKLILTAAAAMMVLASCTKTKVESIDGPKEIAFKKIEGAMTKATQTLGTGIAMGVYAINHETSTYYFENVKFGYVATPTPSAWLAFDEDEHTPQYWPLSGALDFVVYAPWEATAGAKHAINLTDKTITFNIPANNTVDYMYGAEYYNNDDDKGYTKQDAAIAVNLKHALALIEVKLSASAENIVTLENVTLNGIKESGSITYNYSTSSFTQSYTQDGDPVSDKTVNHSFAIEDSEKPLTSTILTKSVYVMPNQPRTSLTLSYTLAGHTGNLSVDIDLSGTDTKWENGKKYIYNINITPQEIKFAPTEEIWGVEEYDYNPTGNNVTLKTPQP